MLTSIPDVIGELIIICAARSNSISYIVIPEMYNYSIVHPYAKTTFVTKWDFSREYVSNIACY